MVKFTPLIKILLICKILFTYKVKLLILKIIRNITFLAQNADKTFGKNISAYKLLSYFKKL